MTFPQRHYDPRKLNVLSVKYFKSIDELKKNLWFSEKKKPREPSFSK